MTFMRSFLELSNDLALSHCNCPQSVDIEAGLGKFGQHRLRASRSTFAGDQQNPAAWLGGLRLTIFPRGSCLDTEGFIGL